MKKIVIIGAIGKVGSKVAHKLLQRGHSVTLVARNAQKLKPFVEIGAETVSLAFQQLDQLTEVLTGADVVLTMIASNHLAVDFLEEQRQQTDAQVAAIKKSGIKNVVNLSSVGCDVIEGNGILKGLTEMEVKLNQLKGINVIHLRPTFYMENAFYGIGLIKYQGIHGLPIDGDKKFPMIATEDVAIVIVDKLTALDFTGKSVFPILGPRDYNLKEMTQAMGLAIGLPALPYLEFSPDDTIGGLVQLGGSKDFAEKYVELMVATNHGLLNYHPRTKEYTTKTTLNVFAQDVFAPAYQAG